MLLDKFWFGFWGYWYREKFVLGLYECVRNICEKSLLVYVNFVLWTWQNFVGMCMDIFVGMENFVGMKF